MSQDVWNVVGVVLLALVIFVVLRWRLGRRIRWLRRLELHSMERAILAMSGQFLRRSRRYFKYRPQDSSLTGTPWEHWDR